MKRKKICVLVTARPSYSRIKSALTAIEAHPDLELQLVVAASALLDRYGNAFKVIERDGFDIRARVYMVLEGENLVTSAKSTGLGLVELATVFDNLQPDAVVTVADRYETLATAVAASYMNIPVVHVQGGEVTGSIDEKVRHAVTKLANLHLVSTEKAAERVMRLGEQPCTIIKTGCPSIDLADQVLQEPGMDFDPFERYGCFVGLSDHSGTIYPALANATLGGDVIEVHVTMSRGMFGPDVPASVTMEEMRQLVDGVRFIERMRASPVEKDDVAKDMAPLRAIFTKSVVARVSLAKGTVVNPEHLAAKKPGTGLPADRQAELIGRRLRRTIAADEQVRLEDLDDFKETV